MKIIRVDNFDREMYDDELIAENVNETYGKLIVDFFNDREYESSPNYFRLVEDEYELFKFEP